MAQMKESVSSVSLNKSASTANLYPLGGSSGNSRPSLDRIPSHALRDSLMSIYIPEKASDFLNLNSLDPTSNFDSKSRNFLIQGELLKFYIVVRSVDPMRPNKVDDPNNPQYQILATSIQRKVNQIDFYRTFAQCTIETDFVDETEVENQPILTQKRPSKIYAKVMDFSANSRHTFTANNLDPEKLSATIEPPEPQKPVSTKQDKDPTSRKGRSGSVSVQTQDNNNIKDVFEEDFTAPNFFKLPNGECVFIFEVQFPVLLKDAFVNQDMQLRVAIYPSSIAFQQRLSENEELSRLLSYFYVEKAFPLRCVYKPVKVIQPFAVVPKTLVLRNTNILNFTVENKHKQHSIKLHDVSMYLFDSKDYSSGRKIDEISFRKYFKTIISKESLPATLHPNDVYSFVASVEPIIQTNFPQLTPAFHAQLNFTWAIESCQNSMISTYVVGLTPPVLQELVVSMQAPTPTPLNTLFNISLIITNYGSTTKKLLLFVGEGYEAWKYQLSGKMQPVPPAPNFEDEKARVQADVKPIETKLNRTPLEILDSRVINQPSVLCLEKTQNLGILKPQSSISTSLSFIALKEGLTDIEKITIIDSSTDQTFVVVSGHQIYVRDFSRRIHLLHLMHHFIRVMESPSIKKSLFIPCRLDKFIGDGSVLSKDQARIAILQKKVSIQRPLSEERAIITDVEELVFEEDKVFLEEQPISIWDSLKSSVCFALHKPKNLLVSMRPVKMCETNKQQIARKFCLSTWIQEISKNEGNNYSVPLESSNEQNNENEAKSIDSEEELEDIEDTEEEKVSTSVGNLFPVGRLDKRTSGLILVMNDGDLAFQLLKPGNCPKEYICTVGRIPTEKQTKQLLEGVQLKDGFAKALEVEILNIEQSDIPEKVINYEQLPLRALKKIEKKERKKKQKRERREARKKEENEQAKRRKLENGEEEKIEEEKEEETTQPPKRIRAQVRVKLDIGRNHIVKRLMAHFGLHVIHLHRTRIGNLDILKDCKLEQPGSLIWKTILKFKGSHVKLTNEQIEELWNCVGGRKAFIQRKIEGLARLAAKFAAEGKPNVRLDAWLHANPVVRVIELLS